MVAISVPFQAALCDTEHNSDIVVALLPFTFSFVQRGRDHLNERVLTHSNKNMATTSPLHQMSITNMKTIESKIGIHCEGSWGRHFVTHSPTVTNHRSREPTLLSKDSLSTLCPNTVGTDSRVPQYLLSARTPGHGIVHQSTRKASRTYSDKFRKIVPTIVNRLKTLTRSRKFFIAHTHGTEFRDDLSLGLTPSPATTWRIKKCRESILSRIVNTAIHK